MSTHNVGKTSAGAQGSQETGRKAGEEAQSGAQVGANHSTESPGFPGT